MIDLPRDATKFDLENMPEATQARWEWLRMWEWKQQQEAARRQKKAMREAQWAQLGASLLGAFLNPIAGQWGQSLAAPSTTQGVNPMTIDYRSMYGRAPSGSTSGMGTMGTIGNPYFY